MAVDLLICGRFTSWDDPHVAGSEVQRCIVCACDVWVSPDGIVREDLPKVCLECAIEMADGDEEIAPLPGGAEKYADIVPLVQRLIRQRKGDQ